MTTAIEPVSKKIATAQDMIMKLAPQLKDLLPKHMTPERLIRLMRANIRMNHKLAECSAMTLLAAVCEAATLGLEPNTPLGQCFILPYAGKAQLQIGYRGWIELADRCDRLADLYAVVVREGDHFEEVQGTDRKIVHIPAQQDKRGAMVGVYAVAKLTNGGVRWVHLHRKEVMQRKACSPAVRSGADTPWNKPDFEPAMWEKTAILALSKYLPKSAEFARAVALEESAQLSGNQRFQMIEAAAEAGLPEAKELAALEQDESTETRTEELKQKLASKKKAAVPAPEAGEPTEQETPTVEDVRAKVIAAIEKAHITKRSSLFRNFGWDDNVWKSKVLNMTTVEDLYDVLKELG